MTPEELDKARAQEASRLVDQATRWAWGSIDAERMVAVHAARLAREGWEPVDPLLVEARELTNKVIADSDSRKEAFVQLVLAALRRGIEIGKSQHDQQDPEADIAEAPRQAKFVDGLSSYIDAQGHVHIYDPVRRGYVRA